MKKSCNTPYEEQRNGAQVRRKNKTFGMVLRRMCAHDDKTTHRKMTLRVFSVSLEKHAHFMWEATYCVL